MSDPDARLREIEKSSAVQSAQMKLLAEEVKGLAACYKVLNEHHIDTREQLFTVEKKIDMLDSRIATTLNVVKFSFGVIGVISTVLGILAYLK